MPTVLLIDDNELLPPLLQQALADDFTLETCSKPDQAMARVQELDPDLVLLDLRFPDDGDDFNELTGVRLLTSIRRESPGTPVLVFTELLQQRDIPLELFTVQPHGQCSKPKSFQGDWAGPLKNEMRAAIEMASPFSGELANELGFVIGNTDAMQLAAQRIPYAARTQQQTVTIYGASGTGKTLVASAIHKMSKKEGSLIRLDCDKDITPERLQQKAQEAEGGTLYLHSVQFLETPELQEILLQLIQNQNLRLLVSTEYSYNEILAEENLPVKVIDELHGIVIALPLLQDRLEDLQELVNEKLRRMKISQIRNLAASAIAALGAQTWLHNIRQLYDVIQQAAQDALNNQDSELAENYIVKALQATNNEIAKTNQSPAEAGLLETIKRHTQAFYALPIENKEDGNKRYQFLIGLSKEVRPYVLVEIIRNLRERNGGVRVTHKILAREIAGGQNSDAVRQMVCTALRSKGWSLLTLE